MGGGGEANNGVGRRRVASSHRNSGRWEGEGKLITVLAGGEWHLATGDIIIDMCYIFYQCFQ